jgi:hypothetical protein
MSEPAWQVERGTLGIAKRITPAVQLVSAMALSWKSDRSRSGANLRTGADVD